MSDQQTGAVMTDSNEKKPTAKPSAAKSAHWRVSVPGGPVVTVQARDREEAFRVYSELCGIVRTRAVTVIAPLLDFAE